MIFWEDTDKTGIKAVCSYDSLKRMYTVTVSKGDTVKSKSFGQTYTPTLGMDAADTNTSGFIADELAGEVKKILNI